MIQHLPANFVTDQCTSGQFFPEARHFVRRRTSQAESFAACRGNRRITAKDFRIQLSVRALESEHPLIGGREADLIDDQVRRRIVREGDHQSQYISQRQLNTRGQMRSQDTGPGYFVLFSQSYLLLQIQRTLGDLLIGFDQHGKLDQTGRRHWLVTTIRKSLTGWQMLNGHCNRSWILVD